MNAYCWIAATICLTGTVINVKRINACFIFWLVGEVMWLAFDIRQALPSRALLDAVGIVLAVWGAWENIVKPKTKNNRKENRK